MTRIVFRKWADEWEEWRITSDNWEEEFCEYYNFDARTPGPPSGYAVIVGDRTFYGLRDCLAWLTREIWSKLPCIKCLSLTR
jgi:hypothetical protein